jgi:hypothetical protein
VYGYLVHIIAEATQQRQMNLSVCTSMNKAAQGQHQPLSYAHSRRQQQTDTVHIPNICPKAATNSTVCTSLKGQQRTALCALPSNMAMFKAATNSDYIHGGRETSMISEPVRKAATASAGDTSLLKKEQQRLHFDHSQFLSHYLPRSPYVSLSMYWSSLEFC